MLQPAALNTFTVATSFQPLLKTSTNTLRRLAGRQQFARTTYLHQRPFSSTKRTQFKSSTARMTVHDIKGKGQFEEQVIKGSESRLVVLDCFATWCGPCKVIAPVLSGWSNQDEYSDVTFIKIDVDESPDVAEELGIRAMPTFRLYKDGNQVDELVGANQKALEALIQKHK